MQRLKASAIGQSESLALLTDDWLGGEDVDRI
jgi:hypothetical protein